MSFMYLILIVLCIVVVIWLSCYQRATNEEAFVRTGFMGQKVVMLGGAAVLPIIHEMISVNMSTMRLVVQRQESSSLITHDRLRVDVTAEFYVRVKADPQNIAIAAQTLGRKTMDPNELSRLVEGKFVDALRSVAAEMTMDELLMKRSTFMHNVQLSVRDDLMKNGLELESVSLTHLNQTSIEFFDEKNAFDAEGLVKLTQITADKRKQRNDIDQNTELAIQSKNLAAQRERLKMIREEEYAKMEQEREIAIRRAEQETNIANFRAEKRREAEEAKIAADLEIDLKRILAERDIKNESIRTAQAVERAEVERRKMVELAEQERAIAIAEKSRDESAAKAQADQARAVAVLQEETVQKVRETERAERNKAVELIAAQEAAQKEAIALKVAAAAAKQAAEDQAEALRIQARAEADAKLMQVKAQEEQYRVDAEGTRAVNEAANILSDEQIEMQVRLSTLQHLPDIIKESVKPMENIDDIKILQVNGLGGFGSVGGTSGSLNHHTDNNISLSDQMVNSALRYRSQAPLVDSLLKEIGLEGGDINGLTQGLHHHISKNHADNIIEQKPIEIEQNDKTDVAEETKA